MNAKDPKMESLSALMDVIAGNGKFRIFGVGITTYPEGDDNNRKIHNGCVELEKHGLIYRQIDKPKQVLWMPKKTSNNPRRG